jgi:hypothetical protein
MSSSRGLGVNASAGDGNGNDQVEDFNRPAGANCVLATSDFDNEDIIKVYPNPSSGVINIRINKYFGLVDIQLIDITGDKFTPLKVV